MLPNERQALPPPPARRWTLGKVSPIRKIWHWPGKRVAPVTLMAAFGSDLLNSSLLWVAAVTTTTDDSNDGFVVNPKSVGASVGRDLGPRASSGYAASFASSGRAAWGACSRAAPTATPGRLARDWHLSCSSHFFCQIRGCHWLEYPANVLTPPERTK